jgi:predicted Fe-Mo cluster-binding NifX family protein
VLYRAVGIGIYLKGGTVEKIAVSAKGKDLGSQVDQRFGRCRYFILVDFATLEFDVLENEAAMLSGAGIQTAQMIGNSGAVAVITGNVGPKAFQTLEAAGLKTYLGATGTVREALQQYQNGQLREGSSASGQAPLGRRGSGRGRGAGLGKGGGQRRGRGGRSGWLGAQ